MPADAEPEPRLRAPAVLALDDAAAARPERAATLPDSADAVVVGGGYTGLAAARQLAPQGGATVVVLEAHTLGWGASTRNGGIAHPGFKWGPASLVKRYGPRARPGALRASPSRPPSSSVGRSGTRASTPSSGSTATSSSPGRASHAEDFPERGRVPHGVGHAGAGRPARAPRRRGRHERRTTAAWRSMPAGCSTRASGSRASSAWPSGAGADLHEGVPRHRRSGARPTGDSSSRRTRGAILARDVLVATNGYTDGAAPSLRRRIIPIGCYIIATEPLPEDLARELSPTGRAYFDTRNFLSYWHVSADRRMHLRGPGELLPDDGRPDGAAAATADARQVHPQLAGYRDRVLVGRQGRHDDGPDAAHRALRRRDVRDGLLRDRASCSCTGSGRVPPSGWAAASRRRSRSCASRSCPRRTRAGPGSCRSSASSSGRRTAWLRGRSPLPSRCPPPAAPAASGACRGRTSLRRHRPPRHRPTRSRRPAGDRGADRRRADQPCQRPAGVAARAADDVGLAARPARPPLARVGGRERRPSAGGGRRMRRPERRAAADDRDARIGSSAPRSRPPPPPPGAGRRCSQKSPEPGLARRRTSRPGRKQRGRGRRLPDGARGRPGAAERRRRARRPRATSAASEERPRERGRRSASSGFRSGIASEPPEQLEQVVDVIDRRLGVQDPGAQVRRAAQPGRREPALARCLERRLEPVLVRVELGAAASRGPGRPRAGAGSTRPTAAARPAAPRSRPTRRFAPRDAQRGRRSPRPAARSPCVPTCFQDSHSLSARQRRVPSNPRRQKLSWSAAPWPSSSSPVVRRVPVPSSSGPVAVVRRVAGAVVLRPPAAEGLPEDAPLADHEATDVVRLEEPLVRVDRHRVRPLEVRDATRVPGGEPRRGAVRRVHVEPQALALGHVGELADGVDGAGVRRARDRGDRDRQQARRAVAPDRLRDGRRRGAGSRRRPGRRRASRAGTRARPAPGRSRNASGPRRRHGPPRGPGRGAAARRGARGRCTSRTSAIAMKLAITPPEVRIPKLPSP